MKLLAFESSTKIGSVALIQNGVCTHTRKSPSQKSHSEILHQFVSDIMNDAKITLDDIDCYVAGCGPGSFTGIRVSLNTAKAFAYAFNKPMIVIDSLINLAELNKKFIPHNSIASNILCLINAYKNMSYYSVYSITSTGQTNVLIEPSVVLMKNIKTLLAEPILTVGDGFLTYEKLLPADLHKKMLRTPDVVDNPSAESLGILAYQQLQSGLTLDWKSTKPLYIRSSEAEETKRGIVWSPLDFKE